MGLQQSALYGMQQIWETPKIYQANRNLPKWQMINRELENDKRASLAPTEMIFADYGNNYGFFSLKLAQMGAVISLEGEMTGGK